MFLKIFARKTDDSRNAALRWRRARSLLSPLKLGEQVSLSRLHVHAVCGVVAQEMSHEDDNVPVCFSVPLKLGEHVSIHLHVHAVCGLSDDMTNVIFRSTYSDSCLRDL